MPQLCEYGKRLISHAAPALVYLSVRFIGLVVLASFVLQRGSSFVDELTSWDGQWFINIALNGYDGVPSSLVDARGGRTSDTPYAFFPGYPALVGVIAQAVHPVLAALSISTVAGLIGAYGMMALCEGMSNVSRRAGLVLVALWAAAPMAIVYSMAYSESLFCAIAVWALVALLRQRWLWAGVATAAAGLVRPTAVALIAAVVFAASVSIVRGRSGTRPWIGGFLATSGLVGYLTYVEYRSTSGKSWFELQREGWGWQVDGGSATMTWALEQVVYGEAIFPMANIVVLVGGVALFGMMFSERLEASLVIYAGGVLALAWLTDGLMNSKMRLLLPAFVLLIPLAVILARARIRTILAATFVVAISSAWLGAHALTSWSYAI